MEKLTNGETGAVKLTDVIYLATQEKWDEVYALPPVVYQKPEFINWAGANRECLDTKISRLAHLIILSSP